MESSCPCQVSNISLGYAYSTDARLALQGKPFYNLNLDWGLSLLFTLQLTAHWDFPSRAIVPIPRLACRHDVAQSVCQHLPLLRPPRQEQQRRPRRERLADESVPVVCYDALSMICYYWIPGVSWKGLSVFAFAIWAAALDAGLILSTIVILFANAFPSVKALQWRGHVACFSTFETLDATYGAVLKTAPENGCARGLELDGFVTQYEKPDCKPIRT